MTIPFFYAYFSSMGKKIELPEVEPVHLKPFHGIRPGAIILCGLAAAVLLLFFIICMLPGILSNGSYVSFDINTRNTAVYMDGKYLGSTEGSVYFVPSGHHEFSFSILGADAGSAEISIPDQLFFTLFHHRITPIEYAIGYSGEIEPRRVYHSRSISSTINPTTFCTTQLSR